MYSVRQQRPPSVHHLCAILDVDHRLVLLSCRGILLDATVLELPAAEENAIAPARDEDLSGPALLPPPNVSICVGATPLSMVACALHCVVLLTEDNTLVVLRVHLPQSLQGVTTMSGGTCDDDSIRGNDSGIRMEILLNTTVPMEAVVNRPPTTEHASPLMCTSASRTSVYLQVYRGWMHVVNVANAVARKPLCDVVGAVQLEKAILKSIAVLPDVPNGIVPVLDRHLPTVKGMLVTQSPVSSGGARLSDGMRKWMLPGTPHFAIALSQLAVPPELRGTAAARDLVAFAVEYANSQHRLLFVAAGSGNGKRDSYPYEILPNGTQIVAGVELVPPPRLRSSAADSAVDTATSVLWLLTAKGELLRCSYANSTAGDCEGATAQRIHLRNIPRDRTGGDGTAAAAGTATHPRTLVFTHIAARPAIPSTVVALGDGVSVFLVDPWSLTVVGLILSSGPVVGICDGPRNSLVAVTVRGEVSVTRKRLQCDTVAEVELEGVRAVFAWHSICRPRVGGAAMRTPSAGDGGDPEAGEAFVFLVCRGHLTATTAAFVLSHDGLEEVGDNEVVGVARFDAHADTLAVATWRRTTEVGGDPQNAVLSAVHVSSAGITLSACGDCGAFSIVWHLASAEPLLYASVASSANTSGSNEFCFVAASAGRRLRCAHLSAIHSPEWFDVVLCHHEIACVAACGVSSTHAAPHEGAEGTVRTCRLAYSTWNDLDVYVAFVGVVASGESSMRCLGATIAVVHSGPHPTRSLLASERSLGAVDLWVMDAVGGCFRFAVPESPGVPVASVDASVEYLGRYALPLISSVAQATSSTTDDGGAAVVIFSSGEAVLVVDGDAASGCASGSFSRRRGYPITPPHTATYDTLGGRNGAVVAGAAWSTAAPGSPLHLLVVTPDSLRILRAPLLHRVPWSGSSHPVPTCEVVVRSTRLPAVVDAGEDVVAMMSCGGGAGPTESLGTLRHGVTTTHAPVVPPPRRSAEFDPLLLILVNTLRGSLLTLLSSETLSAKDAMYLEEQEFAIGMEACSLHEINDMAVLATGLCKLAPPSDPQSGRVLVVSVSPLRIRASYVTDREAPYCVTHFTTAAFSDEVEMFAVVGLPSRVVVLRLVGDSALQPVAACTVNTPPTAVTVSLPYIAVSELAWGTEYFEFARREPQVTATSVTQSTGTITGNTAATAPSSATCPAGMCVPSAVADDSSAAFRLLPRCTEAFANSATTLDRSYSKNRFVRACLRRNVHLVALEPQERLEAPPAEDDAGGATGITTSPIVPVCVGGIRLTGRVLCVHVTTNSHAPVLFSSMPSTATNQPRDAGCEAHATAIRHSAAGGAPQSPQRGLRTWNFNSAFEPNFTITPTAPRVLLSCDDGSMYICCGIAAELSRVLIRLEATIAERFLAPLSAVRGGGGLETPSSAKKETAWVWGAHHSVAPYSSVASVRSLARTTIPHGFVNLSIVDLFLTLLTEDEQQALCSSEEVSRESSDVISVAALRSLVASLVLLE